MVDMEKSGWLPKALTLNLFLLTTKHEKTSMAVTQIRIIVSFILSLLPEI